MPRDLDPLQPVAEGLCLLHEGNGEFFLGRSVDDHHASRGGHGGEIDGLDILEIHEHERCHRAGSGGWRLPTAALHEATVSLEKFWGSSI